MSELMEFRACRHTRRLAAVGESVHGSLQTPDAIFWYQDFVKFALIDELSQCDACADEFSAEN
jgi:hypothetical protein